MKSFNSGSSSSISSRPWVFALFLSCGSRLRVEILSSGMFILSSAVWRGAFTSASEVVNLVELEISYWNATHLHLQMAMHEMLTSIAPPTGYNNLNPLHA